MATTSKAKPARKVAATKRATVRKPKAGAGRRRSLPVRRGKIGRPSVLTPALTKQIVDVVRIGNYVSTAAEYVGVGQSTVFGWLARGRRERDRVNAVRSEGIDAEPAPEERPFLEFLAAVERAEAEAEVYMVGTLRSLAGSQNDGQVRARAATAYLERKHPGRWSRSERRDVLIGGDPSRPIEVRVETEQRERTEAILAVLVEVGAFEPGALDSGAVPALESGSTDDGGGDG